MTGLAGLRRALRGAVALGLLGIAAELLLMEHFGELLQVLPLVLCGVGALVAAAGGAGKASPRLLRAVAVVLALVGAFGSYEHLEANYAFEAEIRPNGTGSERALAALTGASPSLAPLAFAFMGGLLWLSARGDGAQAS